jgi:hypothetical protein
MQKQDHRCLRIPCLAIENIYSIDTGSFDSGNWYDGHSFAGECDDFKIAQPLICVRFGKSVSVISQQFVVE